MALQTIKATIQVRYGMEADLQPDKLVTGEWAVAKDTRKVWMCFLPGLVLRMATYEAFEQDMTEIQTILATCQDIQVAVERFMQLAQQHASQAESWSVASKSWAVGGTGTRQGEDTNNSEYWSRLSKSEANRAKEEADRASAIAEFNPDGYFSFSGGRAISENEDLNNFSDLGNYYCPTNNVAYTLENCPAKNAFTMKIFYGTGNGYITQAIRDFYYGNIFSRYKGYSGNWSEWKSLDTTYSEMTAASASAAGQSGLVPAPAAGKQNGYLRGDGTWVTPATNLLGTVPGIPLDQTMGKQLEDEITKINSDLNKYLLKNYVFGGRTYAIYNADIPRLLKKNIMLPAPFTNTDVNNYFVSIALESEVDITSDYFVEKFTGGFNIYFKKRDGSNWYENSAIWFNYTVVINH